MAGGRRRRDPRAGPFAAAWAAAVAALALAVGAAGAEFPCQVRVKGRQRGDPECTKTVWRVPRAEARALGLKRRTVFRSCPSKRAQRRARRGKTQLAAGNLPGGDDKVLAGFEESLVTKSGFLWSAVTYDDAGAPVAAVCAADGTPRAKVLYELDSDLVTRSYGGSVAAAVVDVTDLTNLGSEQYLLQA